MKIETGDFRELARGLADGSIDAIITDPPYCEGDVPLWGDLGVVAARVLKPGGWLAACSAHMFLPELIALLSGHLTWCWIDSILHRKFTQVWRYRLLNTWTPVLVFSNGKPGRFDGWPGDRVRAGDDWGKQHHKWGMSVIAFRSLVEKFSKPGDLVLDPFLGGGTTAIACQETGRRCIGYELDASKAQIARERVAGAQLTIFTPRVFDSLVRQQEPEVKTATCQFCGGEFPTGRIDAKYCKDACRQAAYRQRRVNGRCLVGASN